MNTTQVNPALFREVSDAAGVDPEVTEAYLAKRHPARAPIAQAARINPDFFNSVCDGAGIDPAVTHETLQRINR